MSKYKAVAQNNVHLAIRNGESERLTVPAGYYSMVYGYLSGNRR
jgi:hypothetical protein